MPDRSQHPLDRLGAAAGIAFVALFVAIVTVGSALPAPEHSIAQIQLAARHKRDGILLGAYLGLLLSGALLVFGAAITARQWRAERAGEGWWVVALAGLAGTAVGVMTDAMVITFVRAVEDGVTGDALWIGYPPGPDGFLIAVPLAVFLLGSGLGARASGALPRWLAWFALALAAMLAVGAAGITGDRVDGGVLGGPLLLGYLGLLVWTVGASIALWRRPVDREGHRTSLSHDPALVPTAE